MKRSRIIAILAIQAPAAAPCFPDRVTWLEYLIAAAQDAELEHVPENSPIAGDGLNVNFSPCGDCVFTVTQRERKGMDCQPGWWAERTAP